MKARAKIANLLKATMGLDEATVGGTAIEHATRRRMAARAIDDAEEYWDFLQNEPSELQELIETVVVPETWFFRDSGAFLALARIAVHEWMPRHPGKTFRVLSVPCSTGEEPYTVAMTLMDAGLRDAGFRVDAMDISARALDFARAGIYWKNSFRGDDQRFRGRFFHRNRGRYELNDDVKTSVRFRQGNLLAPDFMTEVVPYDAIFCRNVLIYFDAPTQQRVIHAMARLLTSDGVIFVGPAEPFLLRANGFVSTQDPYAFSYRKAPAGAPSAHSPAQIGVRRRRITPVLRSGTTARQGSIQSPERRAPIAAVEGSVQDANELETASHLADAGKLREAAQLCESHLRKHGPSAAGYYLLGLVCDASGQERQAEECYRKTIYLEPQHFEALMHLALRAQRRGDLTTAHRFQARAQRAQDGGAK